jgi:putative transposase
MRVTPRRIYQIKKQYKETGKIPELKQAGREPIDEEAEEIILKTYEKYKLDPVALEKLIERDYRHPHPTQHHIQDHAQEQPHGGEHEQEEEEVGKI